jgi:hypothetical protein
MSELKDKLGDIWEAVRNFVAPDGSGFSGPPKITNKRLVLLLKNKFIGEMKKQSMDKDMMIVPMCFFVDLHDDDFLAMKPYFPYVVIAALQKFYKIIEEERVRYVNCKVPSTAWYFEFRASEHIDGGDDSHPLLAGKPEIQVQLCGKLKSGDSDLSSIDLNATLNPKQDISDELRNESGMQKDERTFEPIYNKMLNIRTSAPSPMQPVRAAGPDVFATLEANGVNFDMQKHEIHICGKNDKRNLPGTIMRLSVDVSPVKYAVIRYRPEKDKKFIIETFGPLLLGGKSIETGKNYLLYSGAIITIPLAGNPVRIRFSTNKA